MQEARRLTRSALTTGPGAAPLPAPTPESLADSVGLNVQRPGAKLYPTLSIRLASPPCRIALQDEEEDFIVPRHRGRDRNRQPPSTGRSLRSSLVSTTGLTGMWSAHVNRC